MKKSELKEKIKNLVKQVYKPSAINLDRDSLVSLDSERFPVLSKFPKLKEAIISLLTQQYDIFISDIQWVAPKPTTFRIILGNDESFLLIYTDRSWIAQVEGRKYYLLNRNEEEQASQSIARLLAYGAADVETEIPDSEPTDNKPIDNGEEPENMDK